MPLRKLMGKLALAITLAALAAAPVVACSGGEKTNATENGQANAQPEERTPASEEGNGQGVRPQTQTPENTPEPEPTQEPTEAPEPTNTPEPTPELTPEKADAPEPANTPEPTPEPEAAPAGQRAETHPAEPPPDICGRTPEVQNAIIGALAQEGPRMSCQDINEREMYRIRGLDINTPQLEAGDLRWMPNLQTMSMDTGLDNLQALAPETFEGMESLSRLSLSLRHPPGYDPPHRNEQFATGAFARLRSLSDLEIRIARGSPGLLLTRNTLAGMEGLIRLDVDHVHAIDPDALQLTRNLRSIKLTGQYSLEPTKQQTLHPGIFEPLPNLETVELLGLRLPPTLSLGSFEAACRAQKWMPRDEQGENAAEIFVERQRVELMEPTDGGRTSGCLLRIGDNRIIEIP